MTTHIPHWDLARNQMLHWIHCVNYAFYNATNSEMQLFFCCLKVSKLKRLHNWLRSTLLTSICNQTWRQKFGFQNVVATVGWLFQYSFHCCLLLLIIMYMYTVRVCMCVILKVCNESIFPPLLVLTIEFRLLIFQSKGFCTLSHLVCLFVYLFVFPM